MLESCFAFVIYCQRWEISLCSFVLCNTNLYNKIFFFFLTGIIRLVIEVYGILPGIHSTSLLSGIWWRGATLVL